MQIHSLGYRTDLIFPRFEGEIIDRGAYLVILTPSNPFFYWGNFLLFPDPPGPGDLEKWKDLFTREIVARHPQSEHFAYGWDTTTGEAGLVQPFLDQGFHLNDLVVLTASEVVEPPKYNREVQVRPLSQDWEWEQAVDNQVACRESEYTEQGYRVFKRAQMERYRRMCRLGLGFWFGAFLGGRLVADLGLFTDGDLARFQAVGTHPDFRRRGICGALVHQASRFALEKMGVRTLVMVAEVDYHAAAIYQMVGFRITEKQVGIDWWDKSRS
jgi:GNAT superfamily N-acetyltransferase